LYDGDVNAGWHQGWRDNIDAKAGYLLSLVNIGVASHSTFLTIQSKTAGAWQVVQQGYTDGLKTCNTRILKISA